MLFPENFLAVSRIAESIFEGLPSDEAPAFFAVFSDAIQSDGKDLSRVVWQFFAAELRSLPPVTLEVQAAIDTVIKGMDLLAEGKEWPEEDAWAAVRAANWAANWAAASAGDRAAASAASAAAWAAVRAANWAANWAADRAADRAAGWAVRVSKAAADAAEQAADCAGWVAVRRRQRDLLLKLIKEAPITQQENN